MNEQQKEAAYVCTTCGRTSGKPETCDGAAMQEQCKNCKHMHRGRDGGCECGCKQEGL